jgi:hypothetical protein
MILLADTSQSLSTLETETGLPVGQLLTPLTRFTNRAVQQRRSWAIDNGAYAGFRKDAWISLLKREQPNQKTCLFVVAPDVVGDARRTLECFDEWGHFLIDDGWPVALAAQDGLEDLPIPWEYLHCLFIGGTTEWKLGPHAAACIKAALIHGLWVHVGRINTAPRLDYFTAMGVHSFDGSGVSRFSHMREAITDLPLLPSGKQVEQEESPDL